MEWNLGKVKKFSDDASAYNDCPTWRLGLFALNNTATNLYKLHKRSKQWQ